MNELKLFSFNNNQVRTVLINDEPWFVVTDIGKVLNSSKSSSLLEMVEDEEKGVSKVSTLGGNQDLNIVNESGLYTILIRSNNSNARPFRKWVTSEVLPTIRKTGGYGVQAPRTLKEALRLALEQQEQLEVLEVENSVQKQQIAELQPKASYYDWVLQTRGVISPTVIAKQYGKSAQWLNRLLHDLKIQFKQGKVWLLYQKYANEGYTKTNFPPDDFEQVHPHTYWTQKGMLFIYEILKSEGILPQSERTLENGI